MTKKELIKYLAEDVLTCDGILNICYFDEYTPVLESSRKDIAEFIVRALELRKVLVLDNE